MALRSESTAAPVGTSRAEDTSPRRRLDHGSLRPSNLESGDVSETHAVARQPAADSPLRLRRVATAVLAVIVVLGLIPIVLGAVDAVGAGDLANLPFYLLFFLLPANLGAVGTVLTIRRPRNRIGWMLLVSGTLAALTFGGGQLGNAALGAGEPIGPLVVAGLWLASWAFIPAIGLLVVFLPLVYPDGELLSRRWRPVVAIGIVGVAAGAVGPAVMAGPMGPGAPANPFGLSDPLLSVVETISSASNVVAPPVFLLALASLLIRFRRSVGIERQQIKWLLFVTAIGTIAFATSILGIGPISDIAWVVGLVTVAALPVAIGLAILRYGLYEIDRIVNRALVYGTVTAILAGVFAAATALSQRLFISVAGQSSDVAIVLTTLVVVAVYAPVRKRVEAVVDRYFKYDQRAYGRYLDELRHLLDLIEPHRAARRLAHEALANTAATGVAVTRRDGSVEATAGHWPAEPSIAVPIDVAGSPFGAVLVGPRRDGNAPPSIRLRELGEAAAVAATALSRGAALPAVRRGTAASSDGELERRAAR